MTDEAKSLVFFDGTLAAGLGTAICVLFAYALGAAAVPGEAA